MISVMGYSNTTGSETENAMQKISVSQTQSSTQSQSRSETRKVLDEKLRDRILAGLTGMMSDQEIAEYAENLLRPQLNGEIEAAQQAYEAKRLTGEQELASLAAELEKSIEAQRRSYAQSAADVQTAALQRGMGRSSYMLETLANTGGRLAQAVRELTDENGMKTEAVRAQMALAAQQNAQTQGRLGADYAKNLAAKVQELRESQRKEYNQNYLTAVSGSMGSSTTGSSTTTGTSIGVTTSNR